MCEERRCEYVKKGKKKEEEEGRGRKRNGEEGRWGGRKEGKEDVRKKGGVSK